MEAAATDLGRRQFLRGGVGGPRAPMRPPWALPEARFASLCTRCNACVEACEPGVIASGSGGFPEMNFARSGCTFCGACLVACEPRALASDTLRKADAWSAAAVVRPSCLSVNGVVCRACGEACEDGAMGFRLAPGGRAIPRVDQDRCTACGSCLAVCPVHALGIEPIREETTRT